MSEALSPVVLLVVTMFSTFAVVLGAVSIWTQMPDRRDRKS